MSKQIVKDEMEKDEVMQRKKKNRSRKNGRSNRPSSNSKECNGNRKASNTHNDVSWYAHNDTLLNSAANLSYYTALGSKLRYTHNDTLTNDGSGKLIYDEFGEQISGIAVLEYIPGPGASTEISDPINIAANNIYSFVRYQNSGATNYEAADYMLYLLAMDELYAAWMMGVRAYGLVNLYSQTDRYLPRALVMAAGFDYEDLRNNLANFRTKLNAYAAQISAFCVPANMSYFRRHSWLVENVYTDEEVIKPQLYLHRPTGYRVYKEATSDTGAILKYKNWKYATNMSASHEVTSDELLTVDEYFSVLQDILESVMNSEDIGVMSGDTLKAYGRENLFVLQAVDPNYVVLPTKDEEVLSQISNFYGLRCNIVTQAASFDIKSVVGSNPNTPTLLKYLPKNEASRTSGTNLPRHACKILNMHKDNITPADTMVASRWLSNWINDAVTSTTQSGEITQYCVSAGSEIGHMLKIYTIDEEDVSKLNVRALSSFLLLTADYMSDDSAIIDRLKLYIDTLTELSQFDWHPAIVPFNFERVDDGQNEYWQFRIENTFIDYANYTIVGEQPIQNMNECAILSMFNIPQIGTF